MLLFPSITRRNNDAFSPSHADLMTPLAMGSLAIPLHQKVLVVLRSVFPLEWVLRRVWAFLERERERERPRERDRERERERERETERERERARARQRARVRETERAREKERE